MTVSLQTHANCVSLDGRRCLTRKEKTMNITELIEQLKAMPEKMEGCNSEGEIGVINTHKLAEELKMSLRNCDVGTADEQHARFYSFCDKFEECKECPLWRGGGLTSKCSVYWAQLPYEEGGAR